LRIPVKAISMTAGPAGSALSKLNVAVSYVSLRLRFVERSDVEPEVTVASPISRAFAFNVKAVFDSFTSTSISTRPEKVADSRSGVMNIR
jgi:hypothetical protein